MKKSHFLRLIVLLMVVASLVGIVSLTANATTPTKILMNASTNTEWKYLDDNTDPSVGLGNLQGWTAEDFDDSAWKTGTTSFGAIYDKNEGSIIGEVEEKTPVTLLKHMKDGVLEVKPAYFFRTTFTVDDADAYSHLIYTMDITGGAVIYLNGTVLLDTRVTKNNTTNLYYSDATVRHKTVTHEVKDIALKDGKNSLAVEFHAPKTTSGQLYFGFAEMKLVYEDTSAIVAEQLMMNVGACESERNLAWFSGFSDNGEVRLAKASDVVANTFPTENYKTFAVSGRVAINLASRYAKKATLKDLEPSTKYAYVIVGNGHSSEIQYFETGAKGGFSFVYVGDPQLGNKSAHATSWQDTIDKIVANFHPEFVISGGDQLDNGINESAYANVFYQSEFATLPFAPTMGPGHDANASYDSSATYNDHYNLPNMSETNGVTEVRGNTVTADYWFTYNDVLFLHLNMQNKEAVTNGEHRAFIEEAIRLNPDAKWQIVVMHNSLYSTGMHGDPNYKHYQTEIGLYRPLMSAMFSELDIDVVLSAHDHVYVRSQMMDGELISEDIVVGNKVTNPEGVLYLCANSSSGSKHYKQYVKDAYFVAEENYETRKSAVRIDITDTSFTMTSYFLDTMEVFDTFTIEKTSTEDGPTDPLQTPYGRIPEGTDPAIAVFDKDSGAYLGGYDNLATVIKTHYIVRSNVIIYLRKSISLDAGENDGGKAEGIKIFDLGGNTITANVTLFNVKAKNAGDVTVTVKNGKINANGNVIMAAGNEKERSANKVTSFLFDGIKFINLQNNFIAEATPIAAYTVNLTFNDCTFTNVTAPMFAVGNKELAKFNISLNGGYINNTSTTIPTIFNLGEYKENVSIRFGAGAEGKSFMLRVGKSDTQPDTIDLPLSGSDICLAKNASLETSSQYVYTLAEYTPYGGITESAFGFPIIIFDYNGKMIDACETFGEVFEKYISLAGNYIIYLREDIVHSEMDHNAGKAGGKKLIDLNGKTLTVNTGSLFYAQAKNASTARITIKNGTINTNGKTVWAIGCDRDSAKNKVMYTTFENVVFTNVSKPLVTDISLTPAFTFHQEILFNNCTAYTTASLVDALINFRGTELGTVDVQFNGGNVVFANTACKIFNTVANTYTFSVNALEGKYTTVTLPNTVDAKGIVALTNENVPIGLYKTGSNGQNTAYVFSPLTIAKVYLNLTNDLNLVYRVFLPFGFETPEVTFTLGENRVVVKEYTVDENGLYCFTLTAVGPHRMQSVVTASVSATYGDKVYTETNDTVSVKSYLDTVRKENGEDANLVALIDALLVYGASAQQYVGSTDAPVANIGTLGAVEEAGYTLVGSGFAKFGMRLDSAVALRLSIQLESYEGVTLEVSKNGKTTSYALGEYTVKNGTVTFLYDGILANELDDEITFTLKSGETTIGSLTTSANAYLYRANALSDEKLVTLARALYAYGKLANTYQAF